MSIIRPYFYWVNNYFLILPIFQDNYAYFRTQKNKLLNGGISKQVRWGLDLYFMQSDRLKKTYKN